jgi:hypothetical protein
VGSTMTPEAVLAAHQDIVRQLKAGQSIWDTAP